MLTQEDQQTSTGMVAIPDGVADRALVTRAQYEEMYAESIADPDAFWDRARQADRLDHALHAGQEHLASPTRTSRSNGSRTASSTSRPTASTATLPAAATRRRSSGKATTRTTSSHITYRELHAEVCRSSPTSCSTLGREEGRPRRPLPADDPGGRLRHARLRPHRRRPLHRLRRLLAPTRCADRINDCDAKLVITADEAPRGGRRTPLKANADKALLHCLHDVKLPGGEAHRRRGRLGRGPRHLAARGDGDASTPTASRWR